MINALCIEGEWLQKLAEHIRVPIFLAKHSQARGDGDDMSKLIREESETGRLHIDSPPMGESPVSKEFLKRTEAEFCHSLAKGWCLEKGQAL